MKKMIALLGFIYCAPSLAGTLGPFTITCTSGCTSEVNQALQGLEDNINQTLPDANHSNYLTGMADASVFSVKGLGVDYANEIDLAILGAGFGLGAHTGQDTLSDVFTGNLDTKQLRGFNAAPSLMVGVNLGVLPLPVNSYFDPNRLKVMMNYFKWNWRSNRLNFKNTNLGIHARYPLIDDLGLMPFKMLYWHGVHLTTGLEYTATDIQFHNTNQRHYTVGSSTAHLTSEIITGAKLKTYSIPLSLSTSASIGYAFSFFGGVGFDLNLGHAKSDLSFPSSIDITSATASGALDLGDKRAPSAWDGRGFIGFQFGLPLWKPITVQFDKKFNEHVYGLSLSTKVTW